MGITLRVKCVSLVRRSRLYLLALLLVLGTSIAGAAMAQVSDQDALDYVKTVWRVTSYADDELLSTLPMTYSGITYTDYIGFFISTKDVVPALDNGYFTKASLSAATAVDGGVFSSAMKTSSFPGVAATAKFAFAASDLGISNWRDAFAEGAYNYQAKIYFEARAAGCTHAQIAGASAGTQLCTGITISSSGWLDDGSTLQNQKNPTLLTWSQFLSVADLMWAAFTNVDQYSLDYNHVSASYGTNVPYSAAAEIVSDNQYPVAPQAVTFQAVNPAIKPGLTIADYLWQFSDDSSLEYGSSVTHTFQTAGYYSVRLWIEDSDGNWSRQEFVLYVWSSHPPSPDGINLVIDSISTSKLMANVDTPIKATVTVKNIGTKNATTPFVVTWGADCPVSVNPSGSYTNASKQWIVPTLAVGQKATLSYTFTPIRGGHFTQTAVADANNDIAEYNESDNTSTNILRVMSPDLIVDSVTCGANLLANSPASVTVIIKNQGNGAITHSILTSWASTNCPIGVASNGTYTYPGTDWTTSILGAGESTTLQYTFTPIRSGQFTSGTTVDVNNSVQESAYYLVYYYYGSYYGWDQSFESNNVFSGSMNVDGPDLIVQSVDLSPSTLQANSPITVTLVVKNQGKAPVSTPFTTSWWSPDCPVGLNSSGSRIFAGKEWTLDSLAAGATQTLTTTISPNQGGSFTYYATADYSYLTGNKSISEEVYLQAYQDAQGYHYAGWDNNHENNNYYNEGRTIYFSLDAPDLVIQSVDFGTVKANTPGTVKVTIKNQGKAPVSSPFVTHLESYLPVSTDTYGNPTGLTHDWTTSSLAAGATTVLSCAYTPTRGGDFYYNARVDTTYLIDEGVHVSAGYDANNQYHYEGVDNTNEYNNSLPVDGSWGTVKSSAPDLVIQSVSFGGKALVVGKPVTVSMVIKNQGGAAAGAFTTVWSSNCVVAGGQYASTTWSTPSLAAGATSTLTFTFTPVSYSGAFSYSAVIDSTNVVHEELCQNSYNSYAYDNENNNSTSGDFSVANTLSAVYLSTSLESPRPTNTSITLSAQPTGGANVVYRFVNGSTILRDYDASPTYVWTPALPGTYSNLKVLAKDLNGVAPTLVVTSNALSYVITPPLTAAGFTTTPSSSCVASTRVQWTATATGGANLVYAFKVSGVVHRDYSSTKTCTWQPTAAGTYPISVGIRDLNSTTPLVEISSNTINYVVTSQQLTSVSLSTDLPSPQILTNTIRLAATSVGGVSVMYKFLVNNGSGWTILRDYQPGNTFDWAPTTSGSYTLKVWARESTSTKDPDVTSADLSYQINPLSSQRKLPAGYIAGQPITVKINVTPVDSTQNYAIQDAPPAGWTVSAVDNNGTFDDQTGLVKWGPFYDAQTRTLTYVATPPLNTTTKCTFQGSLAMDGVTEPIGGDSSLSPGSFHAADLNNDWHLTIAEVTAYGAAWKKGQAWNRNPNPIPISYVTNAGFIWKKGEVYHADATLTPPFAPGMP